MSQFFVLVEGVNIYTNILDTNQLNIMRGSSFILKDAIDHITSNFEGKLRPISTGASSGLYSTTEECKEVVEEISKTLNDPDNIFSLLTFIVVSCEADDLLTAKEKLLTKLRIQQMQSISQVPDRLENTNYENYPDQLEGRRVAGKGDIKKYALSESVRRRFEYGQSKKQDFYFDKKAKDFILEDKSEKEKNKILNTIHQLEERGFCDNFEDLAENTNYRKLNNKIAVIYMDGNNFSKTQRDFLLSSSSPDRILAQEEFDNYLQGNRAKLIYQLLKEMNDEASDNFHNSTLNDGTIRLETLLWGGDESIFVVPAWLGFELLQTIFTLTKHWKMTINDEVKPLTHAAGIVFCSSKTPIRNTRNLAQAIADNIKDFKDEEKGIDGRAQNGWGYMVLESIDYPTNNNINDFNTAYYGNNLAKNKPEFIPVKTDFSKMKEEIHQLVNQGLLSRRQLYKLVHKIRNTNEAILNTWDHIINLTALPKEPKDRSLHSVEEQEFRLLQTSNDKQQLLNAINSFATLFSINLNPEDEEEINNRMWLWVYLYDLWEYISPITKEAEKDHE